MKIIYQDMNAKQRPLAGRGPDEIVNGHMPGAINPGLGKLDMNVPKTPPCAVTTILCHHDANDCGVLSAASLRNMGHADAHGIAGGLNGWRNTTGARGADPSSYGDKVTDGICGLGYG